MKKTAIILCSAAILALFGPSCAKHSWEETQGLHEGMHKSHGGHSDHGNAAHDGHNKAAEGHHEEKKAAH